MNVTIQRCDSAEQPGWLDLREALWPADTRAEHMAEMASFTTDAQRYVQFIAYDEHNLAVGFVEASLRNDYVNGAHTSPVAFLEGIYVVPQYRRWHIAAQLLSSVVKWATSRGCQELASDALLDNEISHSVHKALGFEETGRVVFFLKALTR